MANLVLGPKQNVWLYYDPARAAWTAAVTPHSSGGLSGGLNGGAAEAITGAWTFTEPLSLARVIQTATTFTITDTKCLVVADYFAVEGTGELIIEGDGAIAVL